MSGHYGKYRALCHTGLFLYSVGLARLSGLNGSGYKFYWYRMHSAALTKKIQGYGLEYRPLRFIGRKEYKESSSSDRECLVEAR